MWPALPTAYESLKRRRTHCSSDEAADYDHEPFASILRAADAGAQLRRQARLERRAARPPERVSASEAVVATLEALSATTRPEGSCPRQHAAWVASCVGPLAEAPPTTAHSERAVALANQLRNELGLPPI